MSFAERQEFYRLSVYLKDALEIDGHCVPFLYQQALKQTTYCPVIRPLRFKSTRSAVI